MPGSIGNDLWALFSGERQGLGAHRELSGWFSQALGRSYPGLSRAAVHASDGCLCVATLGRGVEACKASSLSRAAAERLGGSAVLPTLQGEREKSPKYSKKSCLVQQTPPAAGTHPGCDLTGSLESITALFPRLLLYYSF